jgi:hypothetical protein
MSHTPPRPLLRCKRLRSVDDRGCVIGIVLLNLHAHQAHNLNPLRSRTKVLEITSTVKPR